ncbi:hypothetical protein EDC94DRAFT_609368 [Helicostylum pulchrum]|nr:hypothetical protein EDC94DRAFT_609368 [Helicostylum pulchrum]
MSLKDIRYVVGIDFGAVSSGVSIAHTEEPSVKYTVNEWEEKNKDEKEKSNIKGPKQLLTSILYKADDTIICGLSNTANDKASRKEGDVYINNIKQYILNIDQANEELGQKKEGLTIQKVVTDYLKTLHALAIKCLNNQEDFRNSDKFKKDFKPENIRYCLSCPKSQKDFMEQCFVAAGIIELDDLSYRLVCVTESEASAYYCLSLDRIKSKIVHDQEYFVCDIGHCSFGMSKICADTTEILSRVNLISEVPGQGSMNLENSFRKYLNENKIDLNLNQSIIGTLMEKFLDEIKHSFSVTQVGLTEEEEMELEAKKKKESSNDDEDEDEDDDDEDFDLEFYDDENCDDEEGEPQEAIETSVKGLGVGNGEEIRYVFDVQDIRGNTVKITDNDLNVHVFSPYIKSITDYISAKDEENKNEAKIFLSGNYSSDANFYEKLANVNDGKFEYFLAFVDDTNGVDVVSLGAVSFGLRFHDLQTPFFRHKTWLSQDEITAKKDKEKREEVRNEKYQARKEKPIDFIVGIDFGTTFSGCSYADCRGVEVHENIPIKTLKSGWPGGDNIGFGKTPTLMMYDKKMKAKFWGQAAKQKVGTYTDLTLLGNFKLFLSPKSVATYYGINNKEIKRLAHENSFSNTVSTEDRVRTAEPDENKKYQTKKDHAYDAVDAVDIISDYLRVFHDHAIKKILKAETKKIYLGLFGRATKEDFNIRYVLTVPAMWSASAKETMAQASIDAGIITKDELHNLLIITEPEAAALFCDKTFSECIRDPKHPKAESNFVVCDAGGGTVDLVTFKLETDEETDKPKICQVGEGSGDTCGSSYLDSKFKDYLLKFYKDMDIDANLSNTDFNSVMDHFINVTKVKFCSNSERDGFTDIKLPAQRPVLNVPEKDAAKKYTLRDSNTTLRVKDAVMKTEIFDPIIVNILNLIDKQIKQAEESGCPIKSIVLIGGFSRNPYLKQRVIDHYNSAYKVGVPNEGVAAISNGAVSYGLNPRMVSTKMAGQSLALEVQAPFETKNEYMNKEVPGPNGEKFVRNRLEYFVKKTDRIDGEEYHRTVSVNYPQNVLIAIFSCDFKEKEYDDDKNWRYVSNKHNKIMEETIELPEVEGIRKGTNIQFDVTLRMDHIGVTVIIECLNSSMNNEIEKITKLPSLRIVRKCNFVVFRNKKPLIQYSLAKSQFAYGSS